MTPQEKAMAQLMHVSLIKLADAYQDTIKRLRRTHPHIPAERLDQLERDIEVMLDKAHENFSKDGGDMSMKEVDRIHKLIAEAKAL